MCYQSTVTCHGEGVVGLGGDHIAVFGPVGKGVAVGRCGDYGAVVTIMIGTTARDVAAIARVGRNTDGVCLLLELGYQVAVAGYGKSIVGIGGNLRSVFSPS